MNRCDPLIELYPPSSHMRSKNNRKYKMAYYDDYESGYDKYYEEEDYWCECYSPEEEVCDYCAERAEKIAAAEAAAKRAAEKEQAKGWSTTIQEIKRRMTAFDAATDIWMRIEAFEYLFRYMLNCGAFMAAKPTFRVALIKKLEELEADERTITIRETMGKLRAFIGTLSERPDFVAPK